MFIKKHPTTRNEYIRAGNVWVRNFAKPGVEFLTLDALFARPDHAFVIENETQNRRHANISDEQITMRDILVVSDGYDFKERHKLLKELPKHIAIFAVNKALRKWTLLNNEVPAEQRKIINAYLANNPYPECMGYMPTSESAYYPACVASSRTYYPFLDKYGGDVFVYEPSPERGFGRNKSAVYCLDDYRNPVCAAIGLAYRFGVRKLMLFGCDDSFEQKKDGAIQLENGLWTYPQQLRSHEIIDANLYWLTHVKDIEIKAANWSSGPKCNYASYISNIKEAVAFFMDEPDEEGNPI